MRLIAKGVHLPNYDLLEQVDLIEGERRNLFIEFTKEAMHIAATAEKDRAMALIRQLRKTYFIDEEQADRRRISEQADELMRLSQLAYRFRPTADGGAVDIVKK